MTVVLLVDSRRRCPLPHPRRPVRAEAMMTDNRTLSDRLAALLDHLGMERAHFAAQMPGDLAGLAVACADRIAGVTLVVPVRLDPAPFVALGERVAIITGDSGVSVEASVRGAARLPGARLHRLEGYPTTGWSDVARERGSDLIAALRDEMARSAKAPGGIAPAVRGDLPRQGAHAGVSYRIDGGGPPLVLMPFFLAASQWDPIVSALAERCTVIRIGGAHTGGVAILEERAATPSYQAMFRSLVDLLAPTPDARVLDVGCGSGALSRAIARRLGAAASITAVDVNGYLRGEAEALAAAEGLDTIRFQHASAEALPFADGSFDCAFSVTVLEECNADRALAEMVRVVRPGGRVGVIVRAIDMPQWWSLEVPPAIAAKANTPPQSVANGGVADGSLYRRMRDAGLADLVPFPTLVTLTTPGNAIWRYREDHLTALLPAEELAVWQAARARSEAAGLLFQSHPMHCAVGCKPG